MLAPQLRKLDERNAVRWSNVQALCAALADVPGVRLFVCAEEDGLPAFFKLGIQFDPNQPDAFNSVLRHWLTDTRALREAVMAEVA